jgi:PST family polysaccharide transporter
MVHEPRLAPLLCGMSPVLVLGALGGIQQAVLRRNLRYKVLAAQNLAANIAGGGVAIVLALRGMGVWSLVGQQITITTVATCGSWIFSAWRPGFSFSMRELRELWHFSMHVTGSAFLDFFNRRADDFLIGMFLGSTALGYYSLAYKLLLTFTRLVTSPFNSVAFSAFSRLQDKPDELEALFLRLTRMTAFIAFPCFLCLAAMSPDFIRAVFGAKWISATPVLTILCFIGILHAVAFLHGTLERASGRANWQMWFTLAGAVTNVIGFAFTVHYGVIYVAGWYVLSAYLWLALDLHLVKCVLRHRTLGYLRTFATPAAMGGAMAACILIVHYTLPKGLPAPLLVAAEASAAALVAIVCKPELARNPLESLRNSCKA